MDINNVVLFSPARQLILRQGCFLKVPSDLTYVGEKLPVVMQSAGDDEANPIQEFGLLQGVEVHQVTDDTKALVNANCQEEMR